MELRETLENYLPKPVVDALVAAVATPASPVAVLAPAPVVPDPSVEELKVRVGALESELQKVVEAISSIGKTSA